MYKFGLETLCYSFGFGQFSVECLKWHSCVSLSQKRCVRFSCSPLLFCSQTNTCDSWVEHSYVPVCQSYLPVCYPYVPICYLYVTRMYFCASCMYSYVLICRSCGDVATIHGTFIKSDISIYIRFLQQLAVPIYTPVWRERTGLQPLGPLTTISPCLYLNQDVSI